MPSVARSSADSIKITMNHDYKNGVLSLIVVYQLYAFYVKLFLKQIIDNFLSRLVDDNLTLIDAFNLFNYCRTNTQLNKLLRFWSKTFGVV